MSQFETFEASSFFSKPLELYHFNIRGSDYYFCSGTRDYVFDGNTYQPAAIKRGPLKRPLSASEGVLQLEVPLGFPVLDYFTSYVPTSPISITLRQTHRGSDGSGVVLFSGRVAAAEAKNTSGTLACISLMGSMARQALRTTYSATCQHYVYDNGCKLNKSENSELKIINEISGNGHIIHVDSISVDTDFYLGGLVTFDTDVYRMIVDSDPVAATLSLYAPIRGIEVGDIVQVSRGCGRTAEHCKDRGNFENFMGYPNIPELNPFSDGLKDPDSKNTIEE